MDKNFQYSIGASSFLSFNKKYFPSHEEGSQNLCHLPGGDFSTGDNCEEDLEPLNKSLTSMDWLQKLNADYVTQTNSDNTIKVERSALEEPDSSTSCDTNAQCDNCS